MIIIILDIWLFLLY